MCKLIEQSALFFFIPSAVEEPADMLARDSHAHEVAVKTVQPADVPLEYDQLFIRRGWLEERPDRRRG